MFSAGWYRHGLCAMPRTACLIARGTDARRQPCYRRGRSSLACRGEDVRGGTCTRMPLSAIPCEQAVLRHSYPATAALQQRNCGTQQIASANDHAHRVWIGTNNGSSAEAMRPSESPFFPLAPSSDTPTPVCERIGPWADGLALRVRRMIRPPRYRDQGRHNKG